MLKEHLKAKGISIYALSKESGIAYSTLNDLANGKVTIDNCRVSVLRKLSDSLGISLDALYELCSEEKRAVTNAYNAQAFLAVRAKYYYARFNYNDEPVEIKLCKVSADNTYYIDDIARWRIEAYIRNRRMMEFR